VGLVTGSAGACSAAEERDALRRLQAAERAAPFRKVINGPLYLRLRRGAHVAAVLVVVMAVAAASVWMRDRLPPASAVVILCGAVLVGLGLLARRALSLQVRTRVTTPSEGGLLTALDIGAVSRFRVTVVAPTAMGHLGTALGVALVLTVSGAGGALPWAWSLVVVVGATLVLTLALSARACARANRSRGGPLVLGGAAAAAAGAGYVLGRVGTVVAASGSPWTVDQGAARAAVLSGCVALVVLAAAAAPAGRRALSALAGPVPAESHARRQAAVTTSEYARMSAMVDASPLAGAVMGVWRSVIVLAALGGGLATGGLGLPESVRAVIGPILTGYAFVTVLVASGVVFSVVGPSAMADRHRHLWENSGLTASAVARRGLVYPLVTIGVPSALLATAQSLIFGEVTPRVMALGLTLVGAAVLAESCLQVTQHADGTITHHPLTAWMVLAVSLPVVLIPARGAWALVALVYATTVIGVGLQWFTRRITRLPSSSPA